MRSAIITTYQSEKTISHVLESIKGTIDSVCIVDGRWKKYRDEISTTIGIEYYNNKNIINDKAYLKLIEAIEKIIPDYSTDDTLDICSTYKQYFSDFHIIRNKERVLELDARTKALRHILNSPKKSDWIYIVDSDEIWTDNLKREILEVEAASTDDNPYRIRMKAKCFINPKQFYWSIYERGVKNCSRICDFFSACNSIPCKPEFPSDIPIENRKCIAPPPHCYKQTESYFLHYTIPSLESNLLKSLCYGSYGIQSFLQNMKNTNAKYYVEYFGADRKIENEESLELIELGFKE